MYLNELFIFLDSNDDPESGKLKENENYGELFAIQTPVKNHYSKADIDIICGIYSNSTLKFNVLCEPARRLYIYSQDAFSDFVHAWMSEFPIQAEIVRFGRKVLAAGKLSCQAAYRASIDRGDPDIRIVLEASYKVWHEIDRLRGLLRFSPDKEGIYTAWCAPDHFVLPALKEHFSGRFGRTPWAIIDEKRDIFISSKAVKSPAPVKKKWDEWEELWRNYHKTINNESRNNPALQRQFMPRRYCKYLTEL